MSAIMTFNVCMLCLQCIAIVIVFRRPNWESSRIDEQNSQPIATPNVKKKRANMNYMLASIRSERASNFVFSCFTVFFAHLLFLPNWFVSKFVNMSAILVICVCKCSSKHSAYLNSQELFCAIRNCVSNMLDHSCSKYKNGIYTKYLRRFENFRSRHF